MDTNCQMNIFSKIFLKIYELLFNWYFTYFPKNSISIHNDTFQLLQKEVAGIDISDIDVSQTWYEYQNTLKNKLLFDNINEFLRWDVIQQTMFYYPSKEEYFTLKNKSYWPQLEPALKESSVGHPLPYFLLPSSSSNLVHHGYSLSFLLDRVDLQTFKHASIFEIGGGYGSLARLCKQLGHLAQYTICDLPLFGALQRYYLSNVLGNVDAMNFNIDSKVHDNHFESIFIGLWSLSEIPIPNRSVFYPKIQHCNHVLIAFQEQFESNNNHTYFLTYNALFPNKRWEIINIPTIPGNYYLVGSIK